VFLQLAADRSAEVRAKLFFFSQTWGWSDPAGFAAIVRFVHETFHVPVQPLAHLADATTRRDFPLMLGMLAVGGDARVPSITFYFWPRAAAER